MSPFHSLLHLQSRQARRSRNRITLIFCLLGLTALPLVGNDWVDRSVVVAKDASRSLESFVALALRQNPQLQAARTVLESAQGQIDSAGRLENPSLKLSYANDAAFNDEGEQGYGIGFAQKFPITRRLQLERWIAKDSLALAKAEIADQERLLRRDVEFAVYALEEADAELALRDRLIELNREYLRFIESRIEIGEASEVDANRLRLEIFSMEQSRREVQNGVITQAAELRQLCGLSVDEPVDVDFDFRLLTKAPVFPDVDELTLKTHPT